MNPNLVLWVLQALLALAFAVVFHLRRPGEAQNVIVNAGLGALALAVAIGRFAIAPL